MSQGALDQWLAIGAMGAFHGLNPAMGWLFAVALGMHRKSRTVVIAALAPILLGHAAAIGLVLYAAIGLGAFIDRRLLTMIGGAILIGWALWHSINGHRHRVRVGMRTGLLGLGLWSFLMASAHGAGLMLLPFALPLCTGGAPSPPANGAVAGLAIIGVHTGTMLLVIAAVAIVVYEWIGLAFLRQAWINVDLIWSIALAASGAAMLLA